MKRLFLYILSFIFIITSSGVMVNMHYCMGKVAGSSISLINHVSSKCDKCGMEKSKTKGKGCCRDSNKLVKNTIDQKLANSSIKIDNQFVNLFSFENNEFKIISFPPSDSITIRYHAPPLYCGVPNYISHCSYLI